MIGRILTRLSRCAVVVLATSCAFVFVPVLATVDPASSVRAAGPKTFLVTRAADDANDANCPYGNSCTLRQAVNASNANDPGSGQSNTIVFNYGTNTQTTTLTSAIAIARNVVIAGNGAGFTMIAGTGTGPNVFTLQTGSNASLVLSGVTISGGNTGVVMPMSSGGALSVHDTTFVGNAIGIDASGTGTVTGDRVVFKNASTAALYAGNAPVTVTNSTFSGNANGVQQPNGSNAIVHVAGSTFSGNGIAVYTDTGNSALTVTDSILTASTIANCGGTGVIADGGYNLAYGMSGADASCPATFMRTTDPKLGPLTTDNVSKTQTFALQSGSPAIDAGTCMYTDAGGAPRTFIVDPRGIARPQGSTCDIGNYEVSVPGPHTYVVTRTSDDLNIDLVCADAASGGCTFSNAVKAANAQDPGAGNGNTITFDASTTGQAIQPSFPFDLYQNLTITGNGAANTLIDTTKITTRPALNGSASLTLSGITISNGATGVYHSGNGPLVIRDSVFTGSAYAVSVELGGSGTVTVNRVLFSGMTSAALSVNGTHPTTVTNSVFSGNDYGMYTTSSTGTSVVVAGSTFRGNRIALGNSQNTLTVTDSIVAANSINCSGMITDGGDNLAYGRTGPDTSCPATFTRNRDPLLGALAANGAVNGVSTFALQPGSPAIDTGTCQYTDASGMMQTLSSDARGVNRPQGVTCDAGSYEAPYMPPPAPPTHPPGTPDVSIPVPVPAKHATVTLPPGTPTPMPQPMRH